jgi:protein-S-isoprenylcysteine O-methyltransferase Ste14
VVLDLGERLLVLALFGALIYRLLPAPGEDLQVLNGLLLVSEGLVVLFLLLRRRARQISRSGAEWLLALGATCAPFLVAPAAEPVRRLVFAAGVVWVVGFVVQVFAKLMLGRSFGCVPAHRGLKVKGPYRLVRHPMYAGYLLTHLAYLAVYPTLRNLAVYAVCYALQIPRLLAEERLLGRDPSYRDYQTEVRYRLIPGLF